MNGSLDVWMTGWNDSNATNSPGREENTNKENLKNTNDTSEHYALSEYPTYMKIYVTLANILILVIGVFGNLLVPVVVWKNKDMRSSTNLLLVNLSMADILFLLVTIPDVLVEIQMKPDSWILKAETGKIIDFLEWVTLLGSLLTLLTIAFDRYYAVCKPLKARYKLTQRRALGTVVMLWMIACSASTPIFKWDYNHKYWMVIMMLVSFFPLMLIIIYAVVIRRLVMTPRVSGTRKNNMQARKQVVKMLLTLVVVYIICLLPIYILRVRSVLYDPPLPFSLETNANLFHFGYIMVEINSSINPIIYNVMSLKFREAFMRVLGCHH